MKLTLLKRLMDSKKAKLGFGLFFIMSCITIIGSRLLPFDPLAYESYLANLAPSNAYLDVPVMNDEIVDITGGVSFSVALLESKDIVIWGDGLNGELEDHEYKAIAAGKNHMIAADVEDNLYALGDDSFHQDKPNTKDMAKIKEEGIKKLIASDEYSGCLSKAGNLFLWGNTNMIIGNQAFSQYQTQIEDVVASSNGILLKLKDNKIVMLGADGLALSNIPEKLAQGKIEVKDMVLTYHNAAIIDESGNLMVWGENEDDIRNPKIMENLQMITSSRYSFHALDTFGKVVSWGSNAFHETDVPTIHSADKVFAHDFQAYAIGDDKVYAWGLDGFLLGSDHQGRDILTRLVHGGAVTMYLSFIACIISTILGVLFGVICGYFGGAIDHYGMRFAEILTSLPFLPIVITLSAFLVDDMQPNARMIFIMVLFGCLSWTSLARLVRSKILQEKNLEYIVCAKVMGASSLRIMFKHLLPSALPLILSDISIMYAGTMLMEAGLSFLGFGVPSPYPSWGNMLEVAQSINVIEHYPWIWLFPALCIIICVYSLNLIQDAIRTIFNPKEYE